MKLGEVFNWVTDQAKGHEQRTKWHIFICPPDGWDEHTFLFINSNRFSKDCLAISAKDYDFLRYDSFIGCNAVVSYDDERLAQFEQKPVGQISPEHLRALFNILADPFAMERHSARRVCNALAAAL